MDFASLLILSAFSFITIIFIIQPFNEFNLHHKRIIKEKIGKLLRELDDINIAIEKNIQKFHNNENFQKGEVKKKLLKEQRGSLLKLVEHYKKMIYAQPESDYSSFMGIEEHENEQNLNKMGDDKLDILIAEHKRKKLDKMVGFCSQCGSPLQKSDHFCWSCGSKIL